MSRFDFCFAPTPKTMLPAVPLHREVWLVIENLPLSEAYAEALAYAELLKTRSGNEDYDWLIKDIRMADRDFVPPSNVLI